MATIRRDVRRDVMKNGKQYSYHWDNELLLRWNDDENLLATQKLLSVASRDMTRYILDAIASPALVDQISERIEKLLKNHDISPETSLHISHEVKNAFLQNALMLDGEL